MADYAIDISYAYAQLGLSPGASSEQVQEVLANAAAYRFLSKARKEQVRRLESFLIERSHFGSPHDSFEKIRKTYHKRAMAYHPDSNKGNRDAEERLKAMNAAYEIIESVHQEAREYFTKSLQERNAAEQDARQAVLREAQARVRREAATEQTRQSMSGRAAHAATRQPGASGVKYLAASIPRYIRNARLSYLSIHAVIGSRLIRHKGSQGLVYDVIMLPEQEFMRARLYLSLAQGQTSSLELTMSKLTPAYTPMDTKAVVAPGAERAAWEFARAHFLKAFGFETT